MKSETLELIRSRGSSKPSVLTQGYNPWHFPHKINSIVDSSFLDEDLGYIKL